MRHFTERFAVFLLIFFAGFYGGIFWQKTNKLPKVFSQPIVKQRVMPENTVKTKEEKEQEVTEALNDPDFKRVHDFLEREKPMQMNLGKKEEGKNSSVNDKP